MNINIHFTQVDATDTLKQYITEKVESLETFFDGILSAQIDVGLRSNHHQKGKIYYAEFKLEIPSRPSLYVSKDAEDLYKAIDKVKDHMKVELERVKGKMHQVDREEIREEKAYQD